MKKFGIIHAKRTNIILAQWIRECGSSVVKSTHQSRVRSRVRSRLPPQSPEGGFDMQDQHNQGDYIRQKSTQTWVYCTGSRGQVISYRTKRRSSVQIGLKSTRMKDGIRQINRTDRVRQFQQDRRDFTESKGQACQTRSKMKDGIRQDQ
jgi:hypothetical protein